MAITPPDPPSPESLSDRPTEDSQLPVPADGPRPWFRRVVLWSVLGGLTPLVPIPFLDDRILFEVRRRLVRDLARDRGVELSKRRVDVLADAAEGTCLGRLVSGCFVFLLKLGRKIFRKVLIFLAVKDSVDVASRVFHEGYLLHLALDPRVPEVPGPDTGEWATHLVRRALDETLDRIDPRPVEQIIGRLWRGHRPALRAAGRLLSKTFRRRSRRGAGDELAVEEERRLLAPFLRQLEAALWEQSGYLESVEATFRERLVALDAEWRRAEAERRAADQEGSEDAGS